MSGDEQHPADDRVEDLEVPAGESEDVKGGVGGVSVAVGDVNGDGADSLAAPGDSARKLPGLHKSTDVTLKRG